LSKLRRLVQIMHRITEIKEKQIKVFESIQKDTKGCAFRNIFDFSLA